MRQRVSPREHFRRGNAATTLIVALQFIYKLRKKLVKTGAGDMITTVWGRGYMVREPAIELLSQPVAIGWPDVSDQMETAA